MISKVFTNIQLVGSAITLGENKHVIDDEPWYYNDDAVLLKRLKNTVAFGSRYTANETTTTCDLCIDAAKRLMNKMKLKPDDFGAVVSVTQTPDYRMPGNAHVVHGKMGFPKDCIALDLELGCSGFIYGLWQAFMIILCGADRVLLLTGDSFSKCVNPKDRTEAPLFCDAGAATIIEKTDQENPTYFVLKSDGTGLKSMYQPAGGYRTPSSDITRKENTDKHGNSRTDEELYMDGFEMFNFTLTEQPHLLSDILKETKKSKDEIDYFIFHQANKYIVDTIAKAAGLDSEKVPVVFPDYGNQNSASIPGAICAALSDKLEGKKNLVMQGFGIGLSWGACQLTTNSPTILKPTIYKGEK